MSDENKHGGVVEERIRYIVGMMSSLKWRRGETAGELATEWGLAQSTVEGYAAEASKRVRASVLDKQAVTETIALAMDRIVREGLEATGKGRFFERKNAIEAAKVVATLVGANAPVKADVSVTGIADLLAFAGAAPEPASGEKEMAPGPDAVREGSSEPDAVVTASGDPPSGT